MKLNTCLNLVLNLTTNEVNIYAFPYDFMALTMTELKGTSVGSISITSTWKMLAREHVKLRLRPLVIGNGLHAVYSSCHLALLILLVKYWSMQMCRTELILVGLTQIRCLSGIPDVDQWRQV